jgi:hypothetical protein
MTLANDIWFSMPWGCNKAISPLKYVNEHVKNITILCL